MTVWNKGLTKEIDSRLYYIRPTTFKKGQTPHNKRGQYIKCYLKNCNKKKFYSPSRIKLYTRFYCSKEHLNLDNRNGFLSGKNSPHWQGGITPIIFLLRRSSEYRRWRKAVLERDNHTCQICKTHGGLLHADHIKSFAYFPNLRFELSNGRTLCKACHKKTPTWGRKVKNMLC